MKVAALIVGEPRGPELWTLRKISSVRCEAHVVQALHKSVAPKWKLLRSRIRELGFFATASRWLGKRLIGAREEERAEQVLDELFDVQSLREWWAQCGLAPVRVPQLNHPDCKAAIEKIAPDVIVRVSGGILKPHIFSQAKLAALNIHHGRAPLIRGVSSTPWGIIENRPEWIGATIHLIDKGIDTGAVLWRGAPQLTPGDTDVTLHFRIHLEAVDALVRILEEYAATGSARARVAATHEASTYRSAFGLGAWTKFLLLRRGRSSRVLLERAIEC